MADSHYDTFLSYASPDLAFAQEAHHRLTTAGFKVWFDKRELDPGVEWHKRIKHGSESSRVLLPVLTPRWKLSEWTKFETYGADAVIPLIVSGEVDEIFTPPLLRFQGHPITIDSPDVAWETLFERICDLLAKTAPDKLDRIVDVRYQANPFFVGREQELNQIHERLHRRPSPDSTQARPQALTALGGTGKTTLARHYLEKFWRCYRQLFWVDCAQGVESEFARLCNLLHPEMRELTDVPEKAQQALRTLTGDKERLLVLDNAVDEVSIQQWIPKSGNCRTLITSRFSKWSAAIDRFSLDVPTIEEAQTLLVTSRFRDFLYDGLPTPPYKPKVDGAGAPSYEQLPDDEQANCTTLADTLGRLPLALEQAAAYIANEEPEYTFSAYLDHYEQTTKQLLDEHVLGSTEYPDSVLTTWNITLEKLSCGERAIMRLMSFLAPTAMPVSSLIEGSNVIVQESAAASGHPDEPVMAVEEWVRNRVQRLARYSMVSVDEQSIALHSLVQTVERLQLGDQQAETLRHALSWIDNTFNADWNDVLATLRLDPLTRHAIAVARHADQAEIPEPTARLMNGVAHLLEAKAQYADAEPMLHRSVEINEHSHGPDDPRVATCLNNLAQLFQATNRLTEAEPLMRRALAIDEQSYGAEHPNVAIRLNNLAGLLKTTNRLSEAEPLYRRALAIAERSVEVDDPNVARHLNNLAALLSATNRVGEAEPLMRRALDIDEQCYGADHPNVAVRLNNLAQLLQTTNRLVEAEPMMRRALVIDEQAYGAEHPDVARNLNNLASLLQATNRLAEAEQLIHRALAIREAIFNPGHPNVAESLNSLAVLLHSANRLAEAEPLMRRALAIYEASFDPDHPKIAKCLNNLAELLKDANRLAEAEPLYRRALAICEASFDFDHPEIAECLNNLASLLRATNRLAEAEPLIRRALAIREASLGPNHSVVGESLNNLALLLHSTNRCTEAEPLMRRALSIAESSFDPDHPEIAKCLCNLAKLLHSTNRLAEAEPLMRRALVIGEQSYGGDHPKVAIDLNNLAQLLQATDRLEEAESLMRRALAIWEQSVEANHPLVAIDLNNLAVLLEATNRESEAEPLYRRALAIDEQSYGADHPTIAIRLNNLATLLRDTNRLAESEPLMRRMVKIFVHFGKSTGHEHPHMQAAIGNYQLLLQQMGLAEQEIAERVTEILR